MALRYPAALVSALSLHVTLAAQAPAERYRAAIVDADHRLVITTTDDRTIVVPLATVAPRTTSA